MQIRVPISKIRNMIYFDYKGYHPFIKTLRQYRKNKLLRYEESELYRYYNSFNPKNLSEALFETNEIESLADIDKYKMVYPWKNNIIKIKGEKGLGIKEGCQYFGNVSYRKGILEFRRLINLYNNIRKKGYNKRKKCSGYLLEKDNDYRIVLTGGNHRMAVIAALKHKYARIKIKNSEAIKLCFATEWPNVKNNLLNIDEAKKIFNRYFEDDGKNKLERINIMNNKKIYQPGAAIQKWDIIKEYLDENDKTFLDIGCNAGYLVQKANKAGLKAIGIESNEKWIDEKMKSIIKHNTLTPDNIKYIRKYDVICLLSVSQQWNLNYGADIEKKMIKIAGNKANKKLFFQPASIKSKYKEQPQIIDNNDISIRNYNIGFLQELFPKANVKYIGKTTLTTKKEPARLMFLVEKV